MNIKHISILLIFILFPISLYAQVEKHATWRYNLSKKEVKAGDEVEIIFSATIDKDWYLYSSDFDPNLGPTVTTFEFKPDASFSVNGNLNPINPKKKFDDLWGGNVTYFIEKAEFRQPVKILNDNFNIKVTVGYQTCSDIDGKCIHGEEEFIINSGKTSEHSNQKNNVINTENGEHLQTVEKIQEDSGDFQNNFNEGETDNLLTKQDDFVMLTDSLKKAHNLNDHSRTSYSLINYLLFVFWAGLISLLTPSVLFMIPITVFFFINQNKTRQELIRNGILFGLFFIIMNTLIGMVLSKINLSEFANFLTTHWASKFFLPIIAFVIVLSYFGLIKIQAFKGRVIGILFMAFTLVLVSFSSTGPIAGAILVDSAAGQLLKPILGMFAFSLAWAIPFTLLAISSNRISSLLKLGRNSN